jgi:hypothetical protein
VSLGGLQVEQEGPRRARPDPEPERVGPLAGPGIQRAREDMWDLGERVPSVHLVRGRLREGAPPVLHEAHG